MTGSQSKITRQIRKQETMSRDQEKQETSERDFTHWNYQTIIIYTACSYIKNQETLCKM